MNVRLLPLKAETLSKSLCNEKCLNITKSRCVIIIESLDYIPSYSSFFGIPFDALMMFLLYLLKHHNG